MSDTHGEFAHGQNASKAYSNNIRRVIWSLLIIGGFLIESPLHKVTNPVALQGQYMISYIISIKDSVSL